MPKFYRQNKNRIDPRYFLNETVNRDMDEEYELDANKDGQLSPDALRRMADKLEDDSSDSELVGSEEGDDMYTAQSKSVKSFIEKNLMTKGLRNNSKLERYITYIFPERFNKLYQKVQSNSQIYDVDPERLYKEILSSGHKMAVELAPSREAGALKNVIGRLRASYNPKHIVDFVDDGYAMSYRHDGYRSPNKNV